MIRTLLLTVAFTVLVPSAGVAAEGEIKVRTIAVSESRHRDIVPLEAPDPSQKGEGAEPLVPITWLRVVIELAGEPVVGATQFGQLKFKAADDQGNALKQQEGMAGFAERRFVPLDRGLMWMGHQNPPKDRILLELIMDTTKREATKIATLEGSVKLLTGKPVELLISDPEKLVNKELPNRELADAGLKITFTNFNGKGGVVDSYLKAKVTGKMEAMAAMDIVDATGKSLSQGTGVSEGLPGAPAIYEIFGEQALPAGAKVKITVLTDIKEIEVPVKLKDVPLP